MTPESASAFASPLPAPAAQASLAVQALRHASSDPDATAILDADTGERLSRRELAEWSAALATGLARSGIGRGDIVALAMPNLAWWPVVALGVWRTGAALAPLNPSWGAAEMARVLAVVRPRLGVAFGPAAAALEAALGAAGITADALVHGEAAGAKPLSDLLVPGQDPFAEPGLDPRDLAAVPISSGLGGLPKGVRLTHGNLSAVSAQVVACHEYDASSVALAGAPVFNAMGLVSSLTTPLSAGAAIVTVPPPAARASPRADR